MKKIGKIVLSVLLICLTLTMVLAAISCNSSKENEKSGELTEEEIYMANKTVKIEIPAEQFKLTSCATRVIGGAKNNLAVMLNSDSGFVNNSRGFAEVSFEVPESGYFQVVVSGGANSYTPVECWINDYDQMFLEFNTLGYSDFTTVGFIRYFEKGENVIRFLGPGSQYYAALDAVYVRGFSTPNNVSSAMELSGIKIPEGETDIMKLLPKIAGFTCELADSSDTQVIKADGTILPDGKDGEDRTCDIKIRVKREDFSVTSKAITVTVPKNNGTAQELADELYDKYRGGIVLQKNQTSLSMLDDLRGIAKIYVEESSDENVVYLTGYVTSPAADTELKIKLRVEKENGDVGITDEIDVTALGVGERLRYTNPLITGADPFVQYFDGYYHHIQAVHSSTNASLILQRSKSFIDYSATATTTIYTFPSYDSEGYNCEVWGWFPILKWTDDHYYVYYAASNGPSENHRMFVLKSNEPNDLYSGFTDLGMLNSGGCWGIGLNFFEWNGCYYAIWSGLRDTKAMMPQVTYMAKMENPWTIGDRVEISAPEYEWEGVGIGTPIQEGSMVFDFDGKIIMLYNANGSFSNRYCLGMLDYVGGNETDGILNPDNWVKRDKPVLDSTDSVKAPGVPGLVKSPDDGEWWLVFHCAKYDGAGWGRYIMAQPVAKDEDGGPLFGRPVNQYIPINMPSGDDYDPFAQQYILAFAKEATLSGNAKLEKDYLTSYGYTVSGIKSQGDKAVFNINVDKAGYYKMIVRYAAFTPNSTHLLKINGKMNRLPVYRYFGPQDYYIVETDVMLENGNNEISFEYFEGGEVMIELVGVKYAGE